eukprot:TRINITY_DN266_c0_g3_i1.p1 TRINITY_DN266_c0_g3~~TRINITY_DN266_c0_g3_i1.p1  ORF type:complete len:511 (+),score=153.68 TRINITY_DN266_c0_g3_i1:96-1628(+)
MSTSFGKVLFNSKLGTLTLAPQKIHWRSNKRTDDVFEIEMGSVHDIKWVPIARSSQIRAQMTNGSALQFGGLPSDEEDTILGVFKAADKEVAIESIAATGRSWGNIVFTPISFALTDDNGNNILEIPLTDISQCSARGKDVSIQLSQDDTKDKRADNLTLFQMAFPSDDAAREFQEEIHERTDISSNTGTPICEFDSKIGNFLTPRGRFSLEMHSDRFYMRGTSLHYNISYKTIDRLYLLPCPDANKFYFVICLHNPIQANTQRYKYLIMQVSGDAFDMELNLTEEECETKFKGLKPKLFHRTPDMIVRVFKGLSGKKVYSTPRDDLYLTADSKKAITAVVKNSRGLLFPLDSGLMFLHKPAIWIRYQDITSVIIERYSRQNTTTTFDIHISGKPQPGRADIPKYMFNNIQKKEYETLLRFIESKGVYIENFDKGGGKREIYVDSDDDESSDDDFEANENNLSDADEDEEAFDESELREIQEETGEPPLKRRKTAPKKEDIDMESSSDDE